MGRGRVQLRRIENKINRQVTFSKRRNGLRKKAFELSVLCDAEVVLIIFSNKGKLYEFASNSMNQTLERYEKCSYLMQDTKISDRESKNWQQEITKLKSKIEILQQARRHMLGEDLGALSIEELIQLELRLDDALKIIRARRSMFLAFVGGFEEVEGFLKRLKVKHPYLTHLETQTMLEQINEHKSKESMIVEMNKSLRNKISEMENKNAIPFMDPPQPQDGCWNSCNALQQNHSLHQIADCEPSPTVHNIWNTLPPHRYAHPNCNISIGAHSETDRDQVEVEGNNSMLGWWN